MRLVLRAGASAACLVLAVSTVSSAELSRYREFELGAPLAAVTAVTQTQDRDLKTVHSRPAVLQQLEWRPRYMRGTPVPGRDSIDRMLFEFVDGRLFKMSVVYAQDRTSGLTNEDMIESLASVYGAPSSPQAPPPRSPARVLDAPVSIAEWRQADASVALQRLPYSNAYTLIVTSLSLDASARKAEATALVLDEREAPQREAALAKKRIDDERQADELARSTNKEKFQP